MGVKSWQPWILAKLRLPFLKEGLLALGALLGEVVKQGGVAGQFLDASLSIAVGVEGGLEATDGQRAFFKDFTGPLHTLGLQFLHRDDLVDEAHVECLLRIVLAAEVPNFPPLDNGSVPESLDPLPGAPLDFPAPVEPPATPDFPPAAPPAPASDLPGFPPLDSSGADPASSDALPVPPPPTPAPDPVLPPPLPPLDTQGEEAEVLPPLPGAAPAAPGDSGELPPLPPLP